MNNICNIIHIRFILFMVLLLLLLYIYMTVTRRLKLFFSNISQRYLYIIQIVVVDYVNCVTDLYVYFQYCIT